MKPFVSNSKTDTGGFARHPSCRKPDRLKFGESRTFRMDPIYQNLKKRTREIVSQYPLPGFYRRFSREAGYAVSFLESNRSLITLQRALSGQLNENLGHGSEHAEKVAIDAGTLMMIEGQAAGYSRIYIDRLILLAQAAGLLHDICRVEQNHAQRGADKAREHLAGYPLTDMEVNYICTAIYNHEAFKETLPLKTRAGSLVSDCLYDADKFRWGSDNFSFTLWDMLTFSKVPVPEFVARYTDGLKTLVKIRKTFRTRTGKIYGPRFIDTGLAIGKQLQTVMETEFNLM